MSNHGNWQKYNSKNPLQRLLIRNFLRAVSSSIPPGSVRTVLDAGCAEAFVLSHVLEQSPSAQISWGIDMDCGALARGVMLNPQVGFSAADITRLPFPDGAFDLVLCCEVLGHLPEPERALQELRRVSSRYVLLSVPHEPFFSLSNLARGKNLKTRGDDPEHVQHWGTASFRSLVEQYLHPVRMTSPFPWLVFLGERM